VATEVLLVKAGMTMREGAVAEWHIADGGEVRAGQPLYRMETEKISLEVEAEASGIVRHAVAAGKSVAPGALIAYILAPGEPVPSGAGSAAPQEDGVAAMREEVAASPAARRLAKEAGVALASIRGTGPGGRITEEDVRTTTAAVAAAAVVVKEAPSREVAASPLARQLASQLGIDISTVKGTGPGGRVTREDVEARQRVPGPSLPAQPAAAGPHRPGERIPLRGMRKVIAERMHASLQDMAQITMGMTVVMDEAVRLRNQLIDEWSPLGIRPSYTDLVIKAVAKALLDHPLLNATVGDGEIKLLEEINIGMAVAVVNGDGLLVPVIRGADQLALREIAAESTRLADAVRDGKLGIDDMAGGTFSITALGMAGVDFFTPIVNPPNVAILGVGRIHDGTAWDGDRPVKRQEMTLSLTIDHRAVDGAPGAEFLGAVRDLLEAPYRLLV
jgi:pyruvate/2-oxoglutarate dehydrogenase complex dihydrolipoamide acyltransferase (E2) component